MQPRASSQIRLCPLCQGEMSPGKMSAYSDFHVTVPSPDRLLVPRASNVNAQVCLECGYIMLFATDPGKLRRQ